MTNPDIEIYVKNINAEILSSWLSETFSHVDFPNLSNEAFYKGKIIQGRTTTKNSENITVIVTPHAAGKSFCSIWFKSDKTPWVNDEACALAFLESHDTEVRCANGGWTELEEKESEQWLCLTQNEKKLIHWG